MKRKAIISAENIEIGYIKSKQSLYRNLSFDLYQGELVCLLGANGAGKSTLLRSISTSQPLLNGKIFFNNKDISTYSDKKLSQMMGLVLTDKTSSGGLLVRELVELGRYPYTGFFGQLNKLDKEIVEKAMSDVCILHKADSYVAELSDGERQKVMIAKALAQECPIVILDEPTAFLDIESRIEIMNLLHYLAMNQNKTILLSTHDIDIALLLADRLWLLSKEKGLVSGVTEDVILSGQLDNFFGSGNVVFNRESGNFLPNRLSNKKVFLKTENHLFHWAKNMLERNGFAITDNETDGLFTLIVSSNCLITIEKDKTLENFSSFEEFAYWLKNTEY
ncbi:MAG: ABC transporter ATP-binding protein [Dysgonomonas sp.]|nr:ABC transporter ATP-binding protein [Dysgonomonas sp.]